MSNQTVPHVRLDGNRKILVIPASFQVLAPDLICDETIDSIAFARGSNLRSIFMATFGRTPHVKTFCIPSSVEFVRREKVPYLYDARSAGRISLEHLAFEPGSRLERIHDQAFCAPSDLQSVCLPASLLEIGRAAFFGCVHLSSVTFEPNSKLKQISADAFRDCSALESFCVPSGVELVEGMCFFGCVSLSTFVFAGPSHLQTLRSLPCGALRSVAIPDSLEVLGTILQWQSPPLTINFGDGSKLRSISFGRWGGDAHRVFHAFIRLPVHRLKHVRRHGGSVGLPLGEPRWRS
jgi:hypothetical protein